MNKKTFFTRAASKALALAATVMMSAAFTACSSSNDDPTTEPKANTVTIDGEEKPILKAGYQYWGDGNYVLFFSLSASSQERVRLGLNKELHVTGNPINLTEKEKNRKRYDDRFHWGVTYLNAHGNLLFYANGTEPVFETGTLIISGSPDGTINIRLENGRVKGSDGKEYTFTLSYSGTMERAGGPTPVEKYVDLGLPSGTKWARCNLGASKPSDYGDYFAWGETEPKTEYSWETYKWMQAGKSDWKYITKYTFADGQTEGIWYDAGGNFIGDNKTTLEAADDAATQKLGSPWRMPTEGEIQELIDHCAWTWTTQDGVNGYKVKGPNGKSIFLPAAGFRDGSKLFMDGYEGAYWSSSLDTDHNDFACGPRFESVKHGWSAYSRFAGYSVRPVRP